MNRNLVLVSGKSASGKSASLRNLKDQPGVVYLSCESGKELPFPNKFKQIVITDPRTVYDAFLQAEEKDDIHTIVVDTLTFLMDMVESQMVLTASDRRSAWADYAQYFKQLMQLYVAQSTKNVIFLAHTADIYNEAELITETMVKVKGSLMNQGIESYFTQVISTKKIATRKLEEYNNPLLVITPQEEALGFKYVFQTMLTKDTVNERIRAPLGMWDTPDTFIDNDLQKVLDHTRAYYQ